MTRICPHCSRSYDIADAVLSEDPHWQVSTVHCPGCASALRGIDSESIELRRVLRDKPWQVLIAIAAFLLAVVVTPMRYGFCLDTAMLAAYGLWRAVRGTATGDRVGGCLLVAISAAMTIVMLRLQS